MKKPLFICISLMCLNLNAIFMQDRAAQMIQSGNFDNAKSMMHQLVVDNPDNAEILYDAGVVSYKTKEYTQAAAYFTQASKKTNISELKEKAYFNSANAKVALKDFASAIADYEQVLKINSDNKRAQHNLKKVQEMLKQQQDKNKQEDNEQQEKKDQEKEKKSNKSDDGKSKDNQKNDQESNDDHKPSQDNKKDNDGEQEQNASKDESQKKQQEEKNQQEQNQSPQNNEHMNDSKTSAEKKEQEATAGDDDEKEGGSPGESENNADAQTNKMAPHLAKILHEQDQKDAALNKMMVKASVNNNMAGYNGQNNW